MERERGEQRVGCQGSRGRGGREGYRGGQRRGGGGDGRGGWRRDRGEDGGRRDERMEERGGWRDGSGGRGGDRGAGGWRMDIEEDRDRRRGERGARGGGLGNRPRGEEQEYDDAGAEGNGDRLGEPQHNQARGHRMVRPLGYTTLEQLLLKDPDDAVQELGSLKQGLGKLLEMTDIRYDLISLLFQVFHHVCHAQGSNETINMLLDMLGRKNFISRHLTRHLFAMRTEKSQTKLRVMPRCIQDIANVLSELQERLPRYLTDVKGAATLLEDAVRYAEKRNILFGEKIQEEVRQLVKFLETIQQERLMKPRTDIQPTPPPPYNFREHSVFPTSNELTDNSHRLYLQSNIKKGKYESVEHYLEVQFRLLREDFVRPLREGISKYKIATARPGKRDKRFQDIRLYYDVTLDEPLYSQSGVTFRIHFDESKLKGVRWQSSKRLIYGSLVILSPDDFKTLVFGTVVNRKPDDLAKGFVEMKLERDEDIAEIFTEKTFIMAESPAYFEAYRHVLSRIQHVTEQSMPLTDYIISASKNVSPPAYIRNDRSIEYDLSPIVSDDVPNAKLTAMRMRTVRILDDREWTRLGNTGLDESQLRAVQAALTQEMTVIQGPPGTGKTYIGLKIVHTLLENKRIWKEAQVLGLAGRTGRANKPILLVCYTNHALDRFLEGVATYNSESIVRVGGRSSSEALKRFNLNSLRSSKFREETPRDVRRRIGEVRGEIESLGKEVKGLRDKINHTRKGLLHERVLIKHMTDAQERSLNQGNIFAVGGQSILVHWLLRDIQMRFPPEEIDVPEDNGPQNEEEGDKGEEELDILEEADLLEKMRRLDGDYPRDTIFTGDANANFDDDTLAFRLNDLDNLEAEGSQQDPRQLRNRKYNLEKKLRSNEKMSDQEANAVRDVWGLEEGKRWRLYRYWAHLHRHESHHQLVDMQRQFTNVCQELREARSQEDFEILKNASVIGMTTTGAANFHLLLQRIQPRIMVVEEAAEVLEAHIVTALTESCQHLILIGDHQQLRPSPTVFKLATQYNLDISLFERMINNEVPYQQLTLQHRMRPEISRLMMMKRLYPSLKDADSVKGFDHIHGVTKNIFFLQHEMEEDSVEEMKSHSNIHEAKFLVGLCRYFLQQGYLPGQITILTTYSGQLFAFKRRMKKIDFEGVRVATVDNFQGEKNDIILLSLVRSNKEGSAGFLKIYNRICVALSRARKGLYCIGNFKLLAQDPTGPNLWREIVKDAEIYGTIGKSLKLQCRNHIGTQNEVSSEADFSKVPEGGCSLPCEARLPCGHVCQMPCHPTDIKHENYKCKKPVDKTLPCGHVQKVSCYKSSSEVICESPFRRILDCGHKSKEPCGTSCTMVCEKMIHRSDFPCGHNVLAKCSASPDSCSKPCNKTLRCGHPCKGSCGKCHQGRLHAFCRERCDRTLVCGHPCLATCAVDCPLCSRKCENRCQHSKCKKFCGELCVPCAERCIWRCQHFRCGAQCGKKCDRLACNDPCTLLLKCGHPCIGLCGEPCPKKCRICDKEEVIRILFGDEGDDNARFVELEDCKHVIEANALDKWMNTDSGSKDTSGAISIKLKKCPWCNTPIRRNLRYGNLIKQALNDINDVKINIFGSENTINDLRQSLLEKLRREVNMDMLAIARDERLFLREMDARLFHDMVSSTSVLSHGQITALKNRVSCLEQMRDLAKELQSLRSPSLNQQYVQQMKSEIVVLQTWLCQEPINMMSQQQTDDANREAKRLHIALNLFRILVEKPVARDKASQEVKAAELQLFDGKGMTAQRADEVKSLLKKIVSKFDGLEISEKERKEIVVVIGLTQGHWYKCPKGHVYAIGDCGGTTQTGSCPECCLGIGGTGHRLTEGNRVS